MREQNQSPFSTIRTEGALLPPDILQRIAAGDKDLEGLTPADYHLLPNEKVLEAVSRSWNRLTGAWLAFKMARENLPEGSPTTGLTRDRWLLPLFQELGYGRLSPAPTITLEEKPYNISHGWQHVPIHLLGVGIELDTRTTGVAGAARMSPHALVQEFLNRSDEHLWAFLSNGDRLRILRDNASLTRPAFVEFDLKSMMEGEIFPDFKLLWMVLHQSRVEAARPEACRLEQWMKTARDQGVRALDTLRGGVEGAIKALGNGFCQHASNTELREKLHRGALSPMAYYWQLLRLVYRMLFLCVVEDRELLHPPDASSQARQRYARWYSMDRLRRLAEKRRGTRHGDLWSMLRNVFAWLGRDEGCPELGLPALGGFLFSPEAMPDLEGMALSNESLLNAVRALSLQMAGDKLRRVDFRNLGSLELGSVYESLLELHPEIDPASGAFELRTAPGHERKTTGSYYTPDSLVQCLLDSALEPVLEECLKQVRELASKERASKGRRTDVDRIVPGSDRVAERYGPGGDGLYPDPPVSPGGVVRDDVSNPSGGEFHPGEHRRGVGAGNDAGVRPVSPDRPGEYEGTGNASVALRTGWPARDGGGQTGVGPSGGDLPDADLPHRFPPTKTPLTPPPYSLPSPHSLTPSLPPPSSLTPSSSHAETALLSLKICDPACGSGHFLIAAAFRIARKLAAVRTGEEEPAPEAVRRALRDVVSRCIYGVDLNPMAVELCKVGLWLEALDPGRPLAFLDHHIRCGNALLGATPELISRGIPDEAFQPIEGDDKETCRNWKKINKQERESRGQKTLFALYGTGADALDTRLSSEAVELDALPDANCQGVRRKKDRFDALQQSPAYRKARLAADAWCAAFVIRKSRQFPHGITTGALRELEAHPEKMSPWLRIEIDRLVEQYHFFHWHLAFPEVFGEKGRGEKGIGSREWGMERGDIRGSREMSARPEKIEVHQTQPSPPLPSSPLLPTPYSLLPSPGFDCILGNPPWERVKIQEKEWFAERCPEIANAPNAASRRRMIEALKTDEPAIHLQFMEDSRKSEGESHLLRNGGRYPLCGRGDINVYTVFAESMRNLLNPAGRVGCVLPSGIATDDTTKFFFQDIMETRSLVSFFDFENRKGLFPAVDSRMKFCLFTARSRDSQRTTPDIPPPEFVFFAHDVTELDDPERRIRLSAEDIALLNPNTRTCPIFRSRKDAELTKAIYRRVPVLIREAQGDRPEENPWGITFCRMFDMSNDSHLFRTREQLESDGWQLEGNTFIKGVVRKALETVAREEVFLPLYEAKMADFFDHRAASVILSETATVRQGQAERFLEDDHQNPYCLPIPRYWVSESSVIDSLGVDRKSNGLLGWRDITSPTNERTLIPTIIPLAGAGDTFLLTVPIRKNAAYPLSLYSCFGSFLCDYVVRQKIGGIHLKYHYFKQITIIPPVVLENPCSWAREIIFKDFLHSRVFELSYTAWDLEPFAKDCDWDKPPFQWDKERRFLLRCELDAAFFHLYLPAESGGEWRVAQRVNACPYDESGKDLEELKNHLQAPRDAVGYIMDTFPIVKRKDEAKYGEYRTKRVILEIYDEMAEAIRTGQPYQTRLDPPPADPRCCHQPRGKV